MGGAQPLAATMTGAGFLGIDVDPERIKRRLKTATAFHGDHARRGVRILKNAVREKKKISPLDWWETARTSSPSWRARVVPDILTDQTSAHDPLNGYVPNGMIFEAALSCVA